MTDQSFEAPMNDHSLDTPRRRKSSADALTGRQAATLVRELNRQLGLWQGTSVKFQMMAQRLPPAGRSDPALAEQALQLFHAVSAEARRFEQLVASQPPSVARHGRINDTRQSFEMVSERLRACLRLLGVEQQAE